MKLLVTGAQGQLGRTLLAIAPMNMSVLGLSRSQLDITDKDQVMARIVEMSPDVIVNTAAYNAVDLAESDVARANAVNAAGSHHLAIAAQESGARLVHLSTDFVFDGQADEPYATDARTNPRSAYGASKCEGERLVRETLPDRSVVLRTAWLFSEFGGNFVSTMLRLMRERKEIIVVDDQVGSPTWARSVASAIFAFAVRPDIFGTYHWTDAGQSSWYEFACAIQEEAFELAIIDKRVGIKPTSSKDYQAAAVRPAYSVLDCSTTVSDLGIEQSTWQHSLRAMLCLGERE